MKQRLQMSTRPRILVLAYHSINIAGNDYVNNDHVALAEDLQLLTELGYHILPLDRIVESIGSNALDLLPRRTAAITFDDGQDFDFFDLPHPEWGVQRSFFNIISDFRRSANGRKQPDLHATSFVIVSPSARSELDQTCMLGCGWWNDRWWQAAIGTGLLGIGNHSWDHNHPTLRTVAHAGQQRGTFFLSMISPRQRERSHRLLDICGRPHPTRMPPCSPTPMVKQTSTFAKLTFR